MTGGSGDGGGFPRGFDAHRRAQRALGLRLTPAERLRWLEETMATFRRWRGRARTAAAVGAPANEAAVPVAREVDDTAREP